MLVKNWPRTAKFLTEEERTRVISRLKRDMDDLEDTFEWKYVFQAFKNPKMYIMVVIYLGANCSTYAIAFFLPTIISGLGYSAATYTPYLRLNISAQLMTIPPYICACIATIGCAWVSDRLRSRGLYFPQLSN